MTVESAVDAAWNHYTAKNESGHHWPEEDYDDCLRWTRDVVEFNDGMYNPLNQNVVCPERYFDLSLEDQPWSRYDYVDPHTGERLTGHLAIKGTVDLVTEENPLTLHYLDWKSGRMWDWANDKPKDYESLCDDPQLLLYFLALSRLYPEYPYIFVTIFYAQTKTPFFIPFERDKDVPRALNMLRERFDEIKNNTRPKRIMDDKKKSWKCFSFCYHGKNNWPGSDKSVCNYINSEVQSLGLDRVIAKHGTPSAYLAYGAGGGSSNRDEAHVVPGGGARP